MRRAETSELKRLKTETGDCFLRIKKKLKAKKLIPQ